MSKRLLNVTSGALPEGAGVVHHLVVTVLVNAVPRLVGVAEQSIIAYVLHALIFEV